MRDLWEKVDMDSDGCWEWEACKDQCGYGLFRGGARRVGGERKLVRAHILAFTEAYGAPEPGNVVMHTCDNPGCCRPSHLREGTRADNNADRDAKGRWRDWRALKKEVLRMREAGMTLQNIADTLDIGLSTTWRYCR